MQGVVDICTSWRINTAHAKMAQVQTTFHILQPITEIEKCSINTDKGQVRQTNSEVYITKQSCSA